MHLLYCDESNLEPKEGDFFVYAGVAIPTENAKQLSKEIEAARVDFEVPKDKIVKFNPCPENLTHEQFIQLKSAIVKSAADAGCKLFLSLLLHEIASTPQEARRNEINRIAYHFDCYLSRTDSSGMVLIDRFSDSQVDSHLREKFSIGLKGMPYSKELRLERVLGFHYSAIGQSHFCSLIDILVGSLRYAVNIFTQQTEERMDTARNILQLVAPLLYRDRHTGKAHELSLFFSPKIIKSQKYRERYEALRAFFSDCGIECSQEITGFRTYLVG